MNAQSITSGSGSITAARAALLTLVTTALVCGLAAPAKGAGVLEPLRDWGATTAEDVAADGSSERSVTRRIRALRRVVRRSTPRLLRASAGERGAELARSRLALDRSLARVLPQLADDESYFFFLAYQAELERLAEGAGLMRAATGRITTWRSVAKMTPGQLARLQAPDTDGDGTIDAADTDIDGDGVANDADASDFGFGVPDAFQARRRTGSGYCAFVTERLVRPRTLAAALRWREHAAQRRGCEAPGTTAASGHATTTATATPALAADSRRGPLLPLRRLGFSASTARGMTALAAEPRRGRFLPLRKLGFRASKARLRGRILTLSVRAKRRVKATFAVISGGKVVLKTRKAVLVEKGKRKLRVKFDRAITVADAKLQITVKAGKRRARGTIPLRIAGTTPEPPPEPPPGCDPDADTDGDSVPDCDEIVGFEWRFFVPSLNCRNIGGAANPILQCGDERRQRVTSNPNDPNTDHDAVVVGGRTFELTDAEEWELSLVGGLSNPSRVDSDTDGVSDVEERERWGTNASHPDSDSDGVERNGAGAPINLNSTLYDKGEIDGGIPAGSRVRTSPTAADTDGDRFTDTEEILGGSSTNPRVADVPEFSVYQQPGTTFDITIGESTNAQVQLSNSQTDAEARRQADERANSATNSERHQISTSAEYEFPAGLSLSISTEHEWSSSKTKAHTTRFENEQRVEAQRAYAESLSTNTDSEGSIRASFRLINPRSDLPLTVKNLSVQAYFICMGGNRQAGNVNCGEPGKRTPLGTLTPDRPQNSFTIGVGEELDINFKADKVDAKKLRAIAANPSNLSFSPATGDIHETSEGPNLQDTIGASIPQSTGGITIDDGSGRVVDLSIATAVDHEWGKPEPSQATAMTFADALAVAGVTLQTHTKSDGHEGIVRIAVPGTGIDKTVRPPADEAADEATGRIEGTWAVFASPGKFGTPVADPSNVDELELAVFDQYIVAWVADADADGLFDREEQQLGTSDTDPDSDGDGALTTCTETPCPRGVNADGTYDSDYFESQVGWNAGPIITAAGLELAPYRVFSDPATCDGDGDGANDGIGTCRDGITSGSSFPVAERPRSTDPVNRDTDGDDAGHPDDLDDRDDPQPLVAQAPPPPPDNTAAEQTAGDYSCPPGTYDDGGDDDPANDRCVVPAGGTVETASFKLCGPASNPGEPPAFGCPAEPTGFYRARWGVQVNDPTCGGSCRLGTWEVLSDGNVILRADNDSSLAGTAVYFAATAPMPNVKLRFKPQRGTATIRSLSVTPVSRAQFLDPGADPFFEAIAIPAEMLRSPGASEAGPREVALPIPGAGSEQVASGPGLAVRGQGDYLARFGFRMSGSSTAPALQVGVTHGSSVPPAAEETALDTTNSGDGITYFAPTGERQPLVQGTVRPADMQSAGPGSQTYAKMMFQVPATDTGAQNVSLPIRTYAGAPATALTNVVIERIGHSLWHYAGLNRLGDGAVVESAKTRWLALGFRPDHFKYKVHSRNASTGGEGTLLLEGSPSPADQAEIAMYNPGDLTADGNLAIPVSSGTGGYHKWGVVARRESMSNCFANESKYHLTDRMDATFRGVKEYELKSFEPHPSDPKLHFAPRPGVNQAQSALRIESYRCSNGIVPSIRVFQEILMTRPLGQFTIGESFP